MTVVAGEAGVARGAGKGGVEAVAGTETEAARGRVRNVKVMMTAAETVGEN